MEAKEIDFKKLNEAVEKFGSLQKANAQLETDKLALGKKNTQLNKDNKELTATSNKLAGQIDDMKAKVKSYQSQLQSFYNQIKLHSYQHDLLCGFIAMVAESPSVTDSIDTLIASFQKLKELGWYFPKDAYEIRSLFVRRVMGDYLKCFHCKVCEAKFIVNKEPHYKSISNYYQCPSCHTSYGVEPDDSFLKAMVSEKQMENIILVEDTLKENETLRPLKAFLNVPCEICGEPITEWTEDSVKGAVEGWGWGHSKCWNTDVGNLRLFSVLKKKVQSKISKR